MGKIKKAVGPELFFSHGPTAFSAADSIFI
jgi:hypothetical protein